MRKPVCGRGFDGRNQRTAWREKTNETICPEMPLSLGAICFLLSGSGAPNRARSSPVDDATLARALHVLAVVLWIGGVVFVTTVLLPAVRDLHAPAKRVVFFETAERRFGRQARVTTMLAGLSGFYMVVRLGLWDRFLSAEYWWVHAMVAVWLLFTLMLFVAEPLFLHRWLRARANSRPESTFRLVERLHWILLVLSLITLIGAVLGSHGMLIIG